VLKKSRKSHRKDIHCPHHEKAKSFYYQNQNEPAKLTLREDAKRFVTSIIN
jgi:hypothetical protein